VTVLLLTCSYLDQEFIRIGYYVNSEYSDEQLRETPPETVQIDKLTRSVLSEKPKVTRFAISWDKSKEDEAVPVAVN
jgi:histone chaperone ASF1